MKASVKQIFNYISSINPTTSHISSLGDYVSDSAQQLADAMLRDIICNLPENTLAYKIATSNTNRYSDKQMWVLAFELEKNADFSNEVAEFYAELDRKSEVKKAKSKVKAEAIKEATKDIIEPVKKLRKLGEFGKFLLSDKNFKSQYFSKKYTQAAVDAFLGQIGQ